MKPMASTRKIFCGSVGVIRGRITERARGAAPVPHPELPLLAERGGTQLRTPRPVVLVDSREQNPFSFARFRGWFAGIERKPLKLGDYSIEGLEEVCTVERK